MRHGAPRRPARARHPLVGGLYAGDCLYEAIRRYESHWLPLLAKTPAEKRGKLLPPLDVAYVWAVHRLNPGAYR